MQGPDQPQDQGSTDLRDHGDHIVGHTSLESATVVRRYAARLSSQSDTATCYKHWQTIEPLYFIRSDTTEPFEEKRKTHSLLLCRRKRAYTIRSKHHPLEWQGTFESQCDQVHLNLSCSSLEGAALLKPLRPTSDLPEAYNRLRP